ncbi:release factor glutamine methyltransferase isoform X2 [Hordeum vulgare subsp. vulgare]|uniref:release factor glutamine methyltransferase isoform X2 n=1 Tax=Hordeum vulgare subsp. vulgare TaxID=112509 RepID=UPI001D1A4521|nr:release factor glutamine methyltransferase isoform X2 [Hordeum vulgare subsp. vulgare]
MRLDTTVPRKSVVSALGVAIFLLLSPLSEEAMLSLSARPILAAFLLPKPKPKPRRLLLLLLRHLHSSSSASALTPPTPRTTTPDLPEDADPTPLFLRPPAHPVPDASLAAFRLRAAALVPPSAPHLHRHLRWLLADASAPAPSSADPAAPHLHLLRAPLDELEALWLRHVRDRRPFQYVVGNEHWKDLVVAVRDGVLIPRPETEAVVDMVGAVEGFQDGWWADLGTGSGAIAVAVARMLGPAGRVFATDVSEVAVEVARLNVHRYGVQDKVEIRRGSWFEPLEDVKGKLMGVISNPPYIPTDDLPGLQPEVGWHEPKLALDGGKDGLDHLLHLCEGLSSALMPGGFFVFEREYHITRIKQCCFYMYYPTVP